MTTRYAGPGGSDSNDGLSWGSRKLTINGIENTPVVAGDVCYVGPGVYREMLTVDVSGSSGSPITYVGDVTGEHTDGVGGLVRVTGLDADADTSGARSNCISAASRDYRTYRGFVFDGTSGHLVNLGSAPGSNPCSYNIFEDCVFASPMATNAQALASYGQAYGLTLRRNLFLPQVSHTIVVSHSSTYGTSVHLVENCTFIGGDRAISIERVGGITIRHNLFIRPSQAVRVATALAIGDTTLFRNNVIYATAGTALQAATAPGTNEEITEDYNNFFQITTVRSNVSTGSNSKTYHTLLHPPLLLDGHRFPWQLGELSKWSPLARLAGTGMATDDFFGLTRPATDSKKSWGPFQATGAIRDTATRDGGSGASIKLPDAGEVFLMRVPVGAESTTIAVKVYREANYDATGSFLPRLVIRQPGQSDRTTTDTGSASTWNTLSDTFTPAASPPYVDVFVISGNVATSGSYAAYADTLSVS